MRIGNEVVRQAWALQADRLGWASDIQKRSARIDARFGKAAPVGPFANKRFGYWR